MNIDTNHYFYYYHRYKKNEVENCFTAWKGWVQGKSNRKNEILRKFKMRMTMSGLAGKFLSWAKYAKYCKRVKTMFRRLITKVRVSLL